MADRSMSEKFSEGFLSMKEKMKVRSKALSEKMSEGMSSMSAKMKEMMHTTTVAERLVEEATGEEIEEPDWARNLAICDMVNGQKATGQEVVRTLKKRLASRSPKVQSLSLTLLETAAKNIEGIFADIASENVLEELEALGTDRTSPNQNKALILIEAWGEAKEELRYLPIFEETYNNLKTRGIHFPGRDNESLAPIFTPPQSVPIATPQPAATAVSGGGGMEAGTRAVGADAGDTQYSEEKTKEVLAVARNSLDLLGTVLTSSPTQEALKDDLTTTLVVQCRRSQRDIAHIVQSAGDNEQVMFEALSVNDELQKLLSKYDGLLSGGEGLEGAQEAVAQPAGADGGAAAGGRTGARKATGDKGNVPSDLPKSTGPGPHMYADLLGEDEEEPSSTSGLVRKPKDSNHAGAQPGSGPDPMADLDELVFGKRDGGHGLSKQTDLLL